MKKVGFTRGALVVELGPSRDMLFCFNCLKSVCERQCPERNWGLLTERLFKYYVRQHEADETNELMQEAHDQFSKTSTKSVACLKNNTKLMEQQLTANGRIFLG